jgi:hypothetical protein
MFKKRDTQICSLEYCHEYLSVSGNLVMHFEPYSLYSTKKNETVIDGEWAMILKNKFLKFYGKTERLEVFKSFSVNEALSSYGDTY